MVSTLDVVGRELGSLLMTAGGDSSNTAAAVVWHDCHIIMHVTATHINALHMRAVRMHVHTCGITALPSEKPSAAA